VLVGIASTAATVFLASLAAYAFSRYPYRGASTAFVGLLFLRMLPSVALVVPYFLVMRSLHLIDTRAGLAIVYVSFQLPYAVWFMKGFFDGIPRELDEAARIDGCTRLGTYVRIVLPLAAAGLSALAVFIFFLAWNELLFALVLSRSAASKTIPVMIAEGISEYQIKWGQMSASALLYLIPSFLFYTLVLRYMLRGLTGGAVKG